MSFKWWRVLARVWWFLDQITPFEFVRIIKDRESDDDYLIRYYLFSTRWIAEWLANNVHPAYYQYSYRVTLHHTLRSDIDGLHDHPWDWSSKILEGGYYEETPDGSFLRKAGDGWRHRTANDFHRLVLPSPPLGDTWSLFVMGPKVKTWHFLDKSGNPVPWFEYLRNRETYFNG